MLPIPALLVLLLPFTVHSHSFLMCTDAQSNFAPNSTCQGFPRGFANFNPTDDILFAFRPGRSNVACNPATQPRASPIGDAYTAQFPMTVARPGQQLILQWQANRHKNGTVEIFKGNVKKVPNTDVEVFMAGPDLAVDPSDAAFARRGPVARLSFGDDACDPKGEEKFGLCAGKIRMPNTEGVFTFQWKWRFNETYSSCFDVAVANSDQKAQQLIQEQQGNTQRLASQLEQDARAVQRDGTQAFTNRAAQAQNKRAKAALDAFNAKEQQNLQMADTNDDGAKGARAFGFGRGRNVQGRRNGQQGQGAKRGSQGNRDQGRNRDQGANRGQGGKGQQFPTFERDGQRRNRGQVRRNGQGRRNDQGGNSQQFPQFGRNGSQQGAQRGGQRGNVQQSPAFGDRPFGQGGQLTPLQPLSPLNRFAKRSMQGNQGVQSIIDQLLASVKSCPCLKDNGQNKRQHNKARLGDKKDMNQRGPKAGKDNSKRQGNKGDQPSKDLRDKRRDGKQNEDQRRNTEQANKMRQVGKQDQRRGGKQNDADKRRGTNQRDQMRRNADSVNKGQRGVDSQADKRVGNQSDQMRQGGKMDATAYLVKRQYEAMPCQEKSAPTDMPCDECSALPTPMNVTIPMDDLPMPTNTSFPMTPKSAPSTLQMNVDAAPTTTSTPPWGKPCDDCTQLTLKSPTIADGAPNKTPAPCVNCTQLSTVSPTVGDAPPHIPISTQSKWASTASYMSDDNTY